MSRRLLVLSVAMTGCVATDVGNPQTNEPVVSTEAVVRIEAFEESLPNALTLQDGVVLTHAWLATSRVHLRSCDAEDPPEVNNAPDGTVNNATNGDTTGADGDDLDVESLNVTDLLSGTSFPNALAVGGTGRSFCGFEVEVRPLEDGEVPAGAPPELAGYSMLVRGLRKDGNPFVVRATLDATMELDGQILLSADSPNELVLGFAVNGWVTQGDLAALIGDPIVIDEASNSELYDAFEDTVVASPRLFRNVVGGAPIAR